MVKKIYASLKTKIYLTYSWLNSLYVRFLPNSPLGDSTGMVAMIIARIWG